MNRLEKFNIFINLVADQFMYGGKKYAHDDEREATDVLFDKFGKNWFLGTICKYCFRYKNFKREKDLLKIACYVYINWLKRGFHIDNKRKIPIDTHVDIKEKEFINFLDLVSENYEQYSLTYEEWEFLYKQNICDLKYDLKEKTYCEIELINKIKESLINLAQYKDWDVIKKLHLKNIFKICFALWERKFADNAGEDTDTWLEEKED